MNRPHPQPLSLRERGVSNSLSFRKSWVRAVQLLFFSCLLAIPSRGIELGGYYENNILMVTKRDWGAAAGDLNQLRLKIDSKITSELNLHLEPRYYYLAKSGELPLSGTTGLDQLVWDRVYLNYHSALLSLTLGKQRIAWGTGYIWNPTDIFNPFVLSFAVREEEESNSQAVRLQVPIGTAGGIDGYVQTDKAWDQTKKGIRAKTNYGLFDLSLSYVDLGEGGFQIGLDTAGELWQRGVRSEIALRSPAGANSYIQSVWGWDYTLDNGIGLNMEYYFNGPGKKNKDDYDINHLGMDYLFFSANKILDELTEVRGSVIMNLDDMGFILYPQYLRNIRQNLDLALEAMLVGGQEGSEFKPSYQLDPTGLLGGNILFIKFIYNF